VQDVIGMVETTKADGGTSMAAALHPYYESKEVVDLIVLVSDEGENQPCKNMMFAELYGKYRKEINPNVLLVLVSFLPPADDGTIRKRLVEASVIADADIVQFRLDAQRPDTGKFDAVLGLVTLTIKDALVRLEVVRESLTKGSEIPSTIADIVLDYS